MIYEAIDVEAPIRQGDIFCHMPRVDFSLSKLAVIDDDGQRRVTWRDVIAEGGHGAVVAAVLPIKSVDAIVITQDCDAVRGEYVCLCQIDDFLQATGKKEPPKTPKKWQSLLKQHSRANVRWFYLPGDQDIGFSGPMAADFRVILRVPRDELDGMRDLRVGRLIEMAKEHFRETLAYFFRRYPYNEWYALTKEQFEAYSEESPEPVEPYPWQK